MSRRGWVLFTVMGVIWGVPYLLIKVADGGVSVTVLVFARVFAGALLLLPLAIRRGQLRALRPYLRWLAAFAAVEVILPWLLLSSAERHLSSSLSGLLIAAVPVIGVGVARLAGDRERLSAIRWAGLAMGLAGVALLGGGISAGGDAWPVLQVLGTALCYSIGPVIADRKLAGADDLAVTAVSLALASRRLRAGRRADLAAGHAVGPGARGAGGAGGRLHRPGVRAVLQADRRGRPGAGHRDHVRQSRGGGGPGRGRARRAHHPGPGDLVRANPHRFGAGHPRAAAAAPRIARIARDTVT